MRTTTYAVFLTLIASSGACAQENKLPPAAQAKLQEAVAAAEKSRKTYYDEMDKLRDKLLRELQDQLEATTKTGNLDGALEIRKEIDRIQTEDFVTAIETTFGASRLIAAAEKSLLGTWDVKFTKRGKVAFTSDWTFHSDGRVTSTHGATKGQWKVELERARIYIDWEDTEDAWDAFQLPLSPKLAYGSSWWGEDTVITARKLQ